MYKMVAYTESGEKFVETKSNNVNFFDRYKNRKNYRIKIFQKSGNNWKMIYSEL